MSICDGPFLLCPDAGTKEQLATRTDRFVFSRAENRVFQLSIGAFSIPLNKRTRAYSYTSTDTLTNTDGKVVLVPDGSGVSENDCVIQTMGYAASIAENYTSVDCSLQYVDLRYDSVVYIEDTASLVFNQSTTQRVALQTSSDDAYVYPFIKENLPITRTRKIISTITGTLFEETVNAGYSNGLRILMPDWYGGSPRHTIFTVDGTEYDAYAVDWYDTFANWQSDGDRNFFAPEWLREVTRNKSIDQQAIDIIYASGHGLETPYTTSVIDFTVVEPFNGSAAKDKSGNIFLSMAGIALDGGVQLISKLVINGLEKPIPTDAESNAWYPIAPL